MEKSLLNDEKHVESKELTVADKTYDKWAELSKNTISYENYMKLYYIEYYINVIKDYWHGGRTLETGCGTGYCSMFMSFLNAESYAFDNSEEVLDQIQKVNKHLKSNVQINKGDIFNENSYQNAPYDVIFHQGVLEHFTDTQIKEIIDLQLKYCQYLIFSVPSILFPYKVFGDERLMSLEQWESLLDNYNIIELRYYAGQHIIAVIKGQIPVSPDLKEQIPIIWQGSIKGNSSLSIVNKNICNRLTEKNINIRIITNESLNDSDAKSLNPDTLSLIHNPLPDSPDIYIRHYWPPDFTRPARGIFVVMQPWEFGGIPKTWVPQIKSYVTDLWVYSNYNKECYVKSGVPENIIHVIPLGIDPSIYTPQAQPMELNTNKTFKFLFVGGTIDRKGIDVLLDAYCEIFTSDDDVCLVIKDFGVSSFYKDKNMSEDIKTIIEDGTKPEILYLNKEDYTAHEMAGIYTACDCFVFPYRGEGFGLPVAEAMACGLPAIVTDKGSCRDFCNEDNSYLINSEIVTINKILNAKESYWANPDKESLKKLMKYAYNNRQEARNIGKTASEFIRTNFTWDCTARKVYDRIMQIKIENDENFQKQKQILENLDKGMKFFNKDDLDSAEEYFNKVLAINPTNEDALYNLGIIYIKKCSYDQAVELLKRSLKICKFSPDVHYALGLALDGIGRKDMASKFFNRAKELDNKS